MRKTVLVFAAALFLVGCTGYDGRDGRDGRDGKDLYIDNYRVTVRANQWERITDQFGQFLFYQSFVEFEELSTLIFDRGVCTATTLTFDGNIPIRQQLPIIIPNEDQDGPYFKEISFDYSPGELFFYVHYSDFKEENPGTIEYIVSLMY